MPSAYSSDVVAAIVQAIGALPPRSRPTWKAIAALAEPACGKVPSREWLCHNVQICDALDKLEAGVGVDEEEPIAGLVERQNETIRRLRQEIKERDEALARYDERLVRYVAVALDRGLRMEDLEAPLPRIFRMKN